MFDLFLEEKLTFQIPVDCSISKIIFKKKMKPWEKEPLYGKSNVLRFFKQRWCFIRRQTQKLMRLLDISSTVKIFCVSFPQRDVLSGGKFSKLPEIWKSINSLLMRIWEECEENSIEWTIDLSLAWQLFCRDIGDKEKMKRLTREEKSLFTFICKNRRFMRGERSVRIEREEQRRWNRWWLKYYFKFLTLIVTILISVYFKAYLNIVWLLTWDTVVNGFPV